MLVLTRQVGDALMVGDDVYVKILAIKGSEVRFGIEASRTILLHREEIYQQTNAQEHVRTTK